MLSVKPSPAPDPRSEAGPVPGYSGHSWMEQKNTDGSAWKMAFVPLPWWTSQSRISTRSTPCAARACAAATATLSKKQKPIACAASAWWPGGRSAEKPHGSPPPSSASTSATAPPAPRSAASNVPGTHGRVQVDRPAAGGRQRLDRVDVRGRMDPLELLARRARRLGHAPTRTSRGAPSPPRARGSARGAPDGPGRRARGGRRGGARCGTPVPYRPCQSSRATSSWSGRGAAGLFASLVAAGQGARVTLISARPLAETASYWAQGGLAAALAEEDSPAQHLEDTLVAGRDLVRRSAAEVLCDEAPARFADLERLGVRFDADRHGRLALGLEGGHSVRRVVHAGGSATGRRILRQLSAEVVEDPRIEVREDRRVRALLDRGRARDRRGHRRRAHRCRRAR